MKGLKRVFGGNKVLIGNKESEFKYRIWGIEILQDRVVILLNIPNEVKDIEEFNNLYCFSYDGELLWQMKPPVKLQGFFIGNQMPIIGLHYNKIDNKLFASDFNARRFNVNLETGEIVSFTQGRW